MSLAQKVREAKPSASLNGPRCLVSKILPTLDQEDADALLFLIYRRLDLTGPEASHLLDEEGIDLSEQVIRRHRNDGCRTCKQKG